MNNAKPKTEKAQPKEEIIREFVKINNQPEKESLSGSNSDKIISVLKGCDALTADEICAKTGISISDILVELTLMEIDGTVAVSIGGRYSLAK